MAGGQESLKLYGYWASPYTIRVKWALKLKGIINDYEYLEENLLEKKSPQLLEYNPVYKKVPVLVHNGKPISESLIIIEYIDETWKDHPLLPRDPYERAQARFWTKFADEKCVPAVMSVFLASELRQAEKAAEEARANLKILEKGLDAGRRRFFSGEEIGFADIAIGWIGLWARMTEEIVGLKIIDEEVPLLNTFFTDFLQIPEIRDCLPPQDKLLEHNKAFHKMVAEKSN